MIAAVTQFVADHGLAGKPLILWGASSGGTLALKLPGTLAALAQPAARTEAAAPGQLAAQQAVVGPSLKVAGIISGGQAMSAARVCAFRVSPWASALLLLLAALLLWLLAPSAACTYSLRATRQPSLF